MTPEENTILVPRFHQVRTPVDLNGERYSIWMSYHADFNKWHAWDANETWTDAKRPAPLVTDHNPASAALKAAKEIAKKSSKPELTKTSENRFYEDYYHKKVVLAEPSSSSGGEKFRVYLEYRDGMWHAWKEYSGAAAELKLASAATPAAAAIKAADVLNQDYFRTPLERKLLNVVDELLGKFDGVTVSQKDLRKIIDKAREVRKQ